jgi:internalin A
MENLNSLLFLTHLICYNNQLTSLKGIENLINLKFLCCLDNQLTSLEGIEKLVNLKFFNCIDNQLTLLKGIESLINLIKNNKKGKPIHTILLTSKCFKLITMQSKNKNSIEIRECYHKLEHIINSYKEHVILGLEKQLN